jgi:hypothetical protein
VQPEKILPIGRRKPNLGIVSRMETIHKMEFNFSPQHHLMVHELMHPWQRLLQSECKEERLDD